MNIANLLKSSEGKTLEFKQDLSSAKGILKTVIAFANTAGGTLIIGIEDKQKQVIGVDDPLKLEEKAANLISDSISPQLLPEIEVLSWRNTYLLAIQVFPSGARPHYLKSQGLENGTYIRVGSTNRLVDQSMLEELKRIKIDDSFDRQAIPELNSEAIDFRVASELFSPERKLTHSDLLTMDILTHHQKKKVPTIGGMILFGKERLKYFPDSWIQMGRFSGLTKTHILDSQELIEYPVLAIDQVMAFVKKHAMHSIKIESVQHKDTWDLPIAAIREAIINAVVHADYSQQGAPIRVAIFDDRVEIENPGLLLFGLTIDEIKQGVSKLRNRVIGQVFYRLGLIERWGSGIKRIIETCIEYGFAEPKFEEIATHFRVTLYTQKVQNPMLGELDQTILSILKSAQNGLSTKEIAKAIDRSPRATRTRLLQLIEKGLIIEIGMGINDPGKKYLLKH